jgi:hypothetical protein
MKKAGIARLPAYPEVPRLRRPSADRIFEIFAHVQRHELHDHAGTLIQVFEPELTPLQLKILELLGVPATADAKAPSLPAATS